MEHNTNAKLHVMGTQMKSWQVKDEYASVSVTQRGTAFIPRHQDKGKYEKLCISVSPAHPNNINLKAIYKGVLYLYVWLCFIINT